MKPRPSHEKRRKEQLRKTRQQDKAEKRAAKKLKSEDATDDNEEPVLQAIGVTGTAENENATLSSDKAGNPMQSEST